MSQQHQHSPKHELLSFVLLILTLCAMIIGAIIATSKPLPAQGLSASSDTIVVNGVRVQSPTYPLYYPRLFGTQPGQFVSVGPTGLVQSAPGARYAGINLFGNSIVQNAGTTTGGNNVCAGNGVGNLLMTALNCLGGNFANGGDQIADTAVRLYTHSNPSADNNYITYIGNPFNDINVYGADKYKQITFSTTLQAAIAYAAIPNEFKAFSGDSTKCTVNNTGLWGVNALGTPPYQYTSGFSGNYITCTIYAATSILYFAFSPTDGSNSTASILIDGVTPSSNAIINNSGLGAAAAIAAGTTGGAILTQNSLTSTIEIVRYTVTPGFHTFKATVTGTGPFKPLWWSSPAAPSQYALTPPLVGVAGALPYVPGQTITLANRNVYQALTQQAVAQMQADGLTNVIFLDDGSNVNAGADYAGGAEGNKTCPASTALTPHPGDCGHLHMFEFDATALGIISRTGH